MGKRSDEKSKVHGKAKTIGTNQIVVPKETLGKIDKSTSYEKILTP
jgi:hypothetical protein